VFWAETWSPPLQLSAPLSKLLAAHHLFSSFDGWCKPAKAQMNNIAQPAINLATANAALITQFVQSPELVDLANNSAQKYFEAAQKSFGHVAGTEAYTELVRKFTENYMTFAQEYSESLMGITAAGQSQLASHVKQASDHVAKTSQAAISAATHASHLAKPRAK
jgi:hypothetical protein